MSQKEPYYLDPEKYITLAYNDKLKSDCWIWDIGIDIRGYGHIWFEGKTMFAYKFFYERKFGKIVEIYPKNFLDHLCNFTKCVNPDHLEITCLGRNWRRGGRNLIERTYCPKGHKYTLENTYINKRSVKICRTCRRLDDMIRIPRVA